MIILGCQGAEALCRRRSPVVRSHLCVGPGGQLLEVGLVHDEDGKIAQIVLFAFHPEYMLWRFGADLAMLMDTAIDMATLLLELHSDWTYFERQAHHMRQTGWISLHKPKSVRGVLRNAMETRRLENFTGELVERADLNGDLKVWLTKDGASIADIQQLCNNGMSLANEILRRIRSRGNLVWKIGGGMPSHMPKYWTSTANPFLRTIKVRTMDLEIMCAMCEAKQSYRVVAHPFFLTMAPYAGLYLAPKSNRCPICNDKGPGTSFIPVDESIDFKPLDVSHRAGAKMVDEAKAAAKQQNKLSKQKGLFNEPLPLFDAQMQSCSIRHD